MKSVAARPFDRWPAERLRDRRRSALAAYASLGIMICAYACLFGWLSLSRYYAYEMHALDMGNMGQAAWNTIHGHPFAFTNVRLRYAIEAWNTNTRLSFHVEALFPFISLVYLVYPHPESLLVLQTAALALGAVPAFLLARDVLQSAWYGVAFAAVYLLFPSMEAMNLYEFHAVSLATPLLMLAFWFAWHRRYVPFAVCGLLAMGCKEEIGLVVALFGLYIALVQRERRLGFATLVVGTGWSLFAAFVVEKHFRQPGTLTFARNRYGYLGHGLSGAVHTVLRHPSAITGVVFTRAKLSYLLFMLEPVGFTALAAPTILLLAAPTLALNIFSSDAHMYSGLGDNSAEIVSVVIIASILGIAWIAKFLGRWLRPRICIAALVVYTLFYAVVDQRVYGYTPLGANYHVPVIGLHQHLADRFVAMVPDNVPVSTQDELDPHLSSRRYLYLFRDLGKYLNYPRARYVLLDVSGPTYPLTSRELHDVATDLLHRGWGIMAAEDGLILLHQGTGQTTVPRSFFSYASPGASLPAHLLHGTAQGIELLGYDAQQTDQPNHRVPDLAFTFYLRPNTRPTRDIQPVVFQVVDGHMVDCTSDPLGLAWYPTSQWSPRKTYVVRMGPIEFGGGNPGTVHLMVAMVAMPHRHAPPSCSRLWAEHNRLWQVGVVDNSL